MPDINGYRAKWGVITPSTNTAIEHDFNAIGPRGMTFHIGRMYVERPAMGSDEALIQIVAQISQSTRVALRDVLTAKPDYLILGVSAAAFIGGVKGNAEIAKRLENWSNLQVTTPATACVEALRTLGASRISLISPYHPGGDEHVQSFFGDSGFEIIKHLGLECSSAVANANVSHRELLHTALEADTSDVDVLVQVGSNLPMLRVIASIELVAGKPVIAVNAATLWHGLRRNGFQDQFDGFGTLLSKH